MTAPLQPGHSFFLPAPRVDVVASVAFATEQLLSAGLRSWGSHIINTVIGPTSFHMKTAAVSELASRG